MKAADLGVQKSLDRFQTAWLTHALYASIQLDVPDAIDDRPVTADDLAKKLNADPSALYRLMRALAANGYFQESSEGFFSHNDASRQLRRDSASGMRSMLELSGMDSMQRAWGQLGKSLKSDKGAFELANGAPLFTYLAKNGEDAKSFNEAMAAVTSLHARDALEGYPGFKSAKRILDIAGGLGHMLGHILNHCPQAEGSVYDLPELESPSREFLSQKGLGARTGFIAGSFLESIPDGFDLLMIKNALWNWSDSDCVKILRNVRRAIASSTTRLLIIENLISNEDLARSTLMDLQMLVAPNGRCRTAAEYTSLVKESELCVHKIYNVVSTQIVECVAT
jgi:ubiquinone/menaquinone biosynthesis C-methylase UbiE